jgi:hypothetical protein
MTGIGKSVWFSQWQKRWRVLPPIIVAPHLMRGLAFPPARMGRAFSVKTAKEAKPRVKHGATVFSMSGMEELNGTADGRNLAESGSSN